jgi:hypothetical protein
MSQKEELLDGPDPPPAAFEEMAKRYPHILEIAMAATHGDPAAVGGAATSSSSSRSICSSTALNGSAIRAGRPSASAPLHSRLLNRGFEHRFASGRPLGSC